jgi:hypothetical protein
LLRRKGDDRYPRLPPRLRIPYEVIHKILSYLSPIDIWNARVIDRNFHAVSLEYAWSVFAKSVCTLGNTDAALEQKNLHPHQELVPDISQSSHHLFIWSGKIVSKRDTRNIFNDRYALSVVMGLGERSIFLQYFFVKSDVHIIIPRKPLRIRRVRNYMLRNFPKPNGHLGVLPGPIVAIRIRVFRNGRVEHFMRPGSLIELMQHCMEKYGQGFEMPSW